MVNRTYEYYKAVSKAGKREDDVTLLVVPMLFPLLIRVL